MQGIDSLRPDRTVSTQEARNILLMEAVIANNIPEIEMRIRLGVSNEIDLKPCIIMITKPIIPIFLMVSSDKFGNSRYKSE